MNDCLKKPKILFLLSIVLINIYPKLYYSNQRDKNPKFLNKQTPKKLSKQSVPIEKLLSKEQVNNLEPFIISQQVAEKMQKYSYEAKKMKKPVAPRRKPIEKESRKEILKNELKQVLENYPMLIMLPFILVPVGIISLIQYYRYRSYSLEEDMQKLLPDLYQLDQTEEGQLDQTAEIKKGLARVTNELKQIKEFLEAEEKRLLDSIPEPSRPQLNAGHIQLNVPDQSLIISMINDRINNELLSEDLPHEGAPEQRDNSLILSQSPQIRNNKSSEKSLQDISVLKLVRQVIQHLEKFIEFEEENPFNSVNQIEQIKNNGRILNKIKDEEFEKINNYNINLEIKKNGFPEIVGYTQKIMSILIKSSLLLRPSHVQNSLFFIPSIDNERNIHKKLKYKEKKYLNYNIQISTGYKKLKQYSIYDKEIDQCLKHAINTKKFLFAEQLDIIKNFTYLKILNSIGQILDENIKKYFSVKNIEDDATNLKETNRIIEHLFYKTSQIICNHPEKSIS